MGESFHRVVASLIFLATFISLGFTYIGIDTYIESGRSLIGDSLTAVKYQWKPESCDELFRPLVAPPMPSQAQKVCNVAKAHHLPPVAVKSILDQRAGFLLYEGRSMPAGPSDTGWLLRDIESTLMDRMPQLKKQYGSHHRDITYMWFFFPFAIGAMASYYYSRSFTPVLFDKARLRFEKVMFGKNKYFSNWDKFIKQNKP